jgi:4-amino-4-deoxy-L-arabinose transferase-like glycosyltransferase
MKAKDLSFAFLLVAVSLFPWLGMSDFHTRGEAREAIVAQSMLTSENWILPRAYNGGVPSKPPFFHWLVALSSLPFGEVSEFTARLPSALLAFGTVIFFVVTLRKELSIKAQCLFSLFLSFSFEWLRSSASTRVDMVHASLLACGLLSGFFALSQKGHIRWWIITSLLLALATLGKGPVGIAIPAFIFSVWVVLQRVTIFNSLVFTSLVKIGFCLGSAFLIALTWYVAAYLQAPDEFFARFWYENVARFTGTMEDQAHAHSFFYLLLVLFVGTLPWSLFLLLTVIKNFYSAKKNPRLFSGLSQRVFLNWKQSRPLIQFCILAAGIIFIFYSIPSSKRGVYLLAAYPFLAVLGARGAEDLFSHKMIKNLFISGTFLVILIQGIIIPRFISGKASERNLGKDLIEIASSDQSIFSYGFEFYGASYYSKKTIFRLEEQFNDRTVAEHSILKSGGLILVFRPQLEELGAKLKKIGFDYKIRKERPLSGKQVEIVEIENRRES